MIIEFNEQRSSSIKSIAVKSETIIKCTTRFMSGKLLMFAKLSLKSFIYSLVELLHFPEENPVVSSIYKKYKIEQILYYQILTDTDSTSIQFIIVSDPDSSYPECDVWDILLEIFSMTEICDRFDKSNEFWKKFNVHFPQEEKVLGLYEVVDFKTYKKPKVDKKKFVRISVKKGEMTTHMIRKSKFSQLNDKRFYFPNTTISLPFGHLTLCEIDKYKKNKGQRIALENNSRINFLNNILEQKPKIVHVDCKRFDRNTKFLYKEELQQNILDYILGAEWKKNIRLMENSMETS